jgi:tetratricopeptide (TPR) repeat protein
MNDVRGMPVSCSNAAAIDGFETALCSFHSYVGDPVASIDAVLAAHPDFVLGHLLRCAVLMAAGERRLVADAARSLQAARALDPSANDREKGLTAAVGALVDGEWHRACADFEAVLVEYPRDLFALQTAHVFDFYRGDAPNLRNRAARVLPQWNASEPGFAAVLGMHAFGLEECNQYADAETAGRAALDLDRHDAWAVHAVAHVLEMTGRIDDGIKWLQSRRDDWAPDNAFAFHNFWHLALYHLERREHDAALALYDTAIYPRPLDACVVLVDAAALLWRLHLDGAAIGERAVALADVWRRRWPQERGHYAFNDLHATLALCLAGDMAQTREIVAYLESVAGSGRGANRAMTAAVGLPLARAFVAFAAGDYHGAIDHALPVRDRAHSFGGSHAQRDVITLTLIEAALRCGRSNLARHLLAERAALKPESVWTRRQLARAAAGSRTQATV